MRGRNRSRNNDIMGNGRGQRPMRHKVSILDEDNNAIERRNVETAIGGATSRERVLATQKVIREEAIRKIIDDSPHVDSREVAKTKLRGLGYEVE